MNDILQIEQTLQLDMYWDLKNCTQSYINIAKNAFSKSKKKK